MHRSVICSTLSLLAGSLLLSCSGSKAPEQTQAAAPPTVHVTATEYAFQAPDTLPAGLTAFHLMNNGKELHHLELIRLAEGMTAADLEKMDPTKPMPEGMALIGGPNPTVPGGTAEAIVDLKPGNYVMVCFVPSAADGKPHYMHGMMHPLTVTASQVEVAAPTPDITIKLSDYTFEATPALTAGHHVIRVENAGPQPHEFVFVKLDSAKTAQDFLQWSQKLQGPPPATVMPGVTGLSVGEANYITVDLTPGEYGMFCFAPDAKDGQPHVAHGMVKQITVM